MSQATEAAENAREAAEKVRAMQSPGCPALVPDSHSSPLPSELWVKVFNHLTDGPEIRTGVRRNIALVCEDIANAGVVCKEMQLAARVAFQDMDNQLAQHQPALQVPAHLRQILQGWRVPYPLLTLANLRQVSAELSCAGGRTKEILRLNILERCSSRNSLTLAPLRLAVVVGQVKGTKAWKRRVRVRKNALPARRDAPVH